MKALVTKTFAQTPKTVLEERPKPTPKPGYSLLRMKAATINQLSRYIRTGAVPGPTAPLVLGNEGAGLVEQSDQFPSGTRVGIYGGNKLGITEDGLFQEWVLVENRRLFVLPDSLTWEEGATLSVNYLTAYRALTKSASVGKGDTVLVSGASGSVGGATIQVAKALGAIPIALTSSENKARHALQAGAHAAIDVSTENDIAGRVRSLTNGQGADWAIDPVGGAFTNWMLHAVRFRGTLVSVGFTGGMQPAFDAFEIIAQEKRIIGYSLHAEDDADVTIAQKALVELAAAGLIKPVIDSTVPMRDVDKGYERLASREALGSIVMHFD
ncbi:MAG: zinc-binding alcohol dehydrogenase family protein [Porticoccaceae bacterium]